MFRTRFSMSPLGNFKTTKPFSFRSLRCTTILDTANRLSVFEARLIATFAACALSSHAYAETGLVADQSTTSATELNDLGVVLALKGQTADSFPLLMDAARTLQRALTLSGADDDLKTTAIIERNLALALASIGSMDQDQTILDQAAVLERQALATLEDHAAEPIRDELASYPEALAVLRTPSEAIASDVIVSEETDDAASQTPFSTHQTSVFEVWLTGSLQSSIITASDGLLEDGYALEFSADNDIAARYVTEDGLDYGAVVSLDLSTPASMSSVLHLSGGFGEIRVGEDSGAEDDLFVGGGDVQAGTGGMDGDAANLVDVGITGSDSATKVSYYTPRIRGVQLGGSFTPDTGIGGIDEDEDTEGRFEDHLGIGMNWVGPLGDAELITSIVGSFGQAVTGDNLRSYATGLTIAIDRFQFGTSIAREARYNERDLLSFGAVYSLDPLPSGTGGGQVGAGVSLLMPRNNGTSTVLALSGDWALGQGFSLLGDIAYNSRDTQTENGRSSSLSSVLAIGVDY